MPAKKITVPVTPDMERALDELPRKRVAGPRSASEARNGSEAPVAPQSEEAASGGSWGLPEGHRAARQG